MNGADFVPLDTVLVFAAGSSGGATECANVTLVADSMVECQEEFTVELTLDTVKGSLSLGNSQTAVTLMDDDGTIQDYVAPSLVFIFLFS